MNINNESVIGIALNSISVESCAMTGIHLIAMLMPEAIKTTNSMINIDKYNSPSENQAA